MISRHKKTLILLIVIIFSFFISSVLTDNTFAVGTNEVVKKWVFSIHRQCLYGNQINKTFKGSEVKDNIYLNVMKDKRKDNEGLYPSYKFGREHADDNIKEVTCKTNFINDASGKHVNAEGGLPGVASYIGIPPVNDPVSFLTDKLNYKPGNTSGSKNRFTITIQGGNIPEGDWDAGKREYKTTVSPEIIELVEDGNSFAIEGTPNITKAGYPQPYHLGKNGLEIFLQTKSSANCKTDPGTGAAKAITDDTYSVTIPFGNSFQEFYNNAQKMDNRFWAFKCKSGPLSWDHYAYNLGTADNKGVKKREISKMAKGNGEYVYGSGKNHANDDAVTAQLYGGSSWKDILLNANERYYLIEAYILGAIKNHDGQVHCEDGYSKVSGDYEVKSMENGKAKQCYVSFNGKDPKTIKVRYQNEKNANIYETNLKDLIDKLNALPDDELDEIGPFGTNYKIPSDDDDDGCRGAGGAGALAWAICPIIETASQAAEGIYNDYVDPALRVDPRIFGNHDNTRTAWSNFRDIANIIFVILLLIVIFSQLTGVGINNYGIKKILPKLIISAILINLSYWICVVLIDISNIVGNGLREIFDQFNFSSTVSIDGISKATQVEGSLISVGIVGAIVAYAGITLWANPAVVISLLVSALSIVIALFFLFVLLAAREAAIIVLTVVSPVAVVLYMLPNTKSVFDRYIKIFKGLLMLYPICGLLVGGGNYISRLLMSLGGQSFFEAFVAMIVGVAPIFFIPTVLKSSFAAMGTIGSKIAGFGSGVNRKATDKLRGSSRYKNIQEAGQRRQTRLRAGLDKDGKSTIGRFGTLIRGGKMNVAKNRAQFLKDRSAQFNEERLMSDASMDAAAIAQVKSDEAAKVAEYMTLLNHETKNGADDVALGKKFDEYMKNGDTLGAIAAIRIAGRRKDSASKFMNDIFKGKDDEGHLKYNAESLSKVAKEIAEGENAKNYRAASALGFEYASNLNAGNAVGSRQGEDGNFLSAENYEDWAHNQENVNNALDHHITNSSELVGTQKSNLKDIVNLMNEEGRISDIQKTRLQKLAQETINSSSQTGIWDSTKEGEIKSIAGWNSTGAAREGEVMNVRGGGEVDYSGASDSTLRTIANNPNAPAHERNSAQDELNRRQ